MLDSFAGAGGFSLGFKLAGCNIIGAIERDEWACETFAFNHPNAEVIKADITTLSDDYLKSLFFKKAPNIILGGPPCQGFSVCNKNNNDPKDPRNSLFEHFIRLGKIFKPEMMVMENVPNLMKATTTNKERVVDIIRSELEKIGYNVYVDILDATNYGVPQIRKRLFIIGTAQELSKPFPSFTHTVFNAQQQLFDRTLDRCPSLWEAISDLPEIEAREGAEEQEYDKEPLNDYQRTLRLKSEKLFNHKAMRHSHRLVRRFSSMKWGDSTLDVPDHLMPHKRNGNGKISGKAYSQNNRRMHPDRQCHTIPASFYANFVHPYKDRNFTAREGARIQSFPDWYVFKGKPTVVSHKLLEREGRTQEKHLCQYNQIGNAVPPLLSKVLAENLLDQI